MAYVGNTPSRGQWRKLTDISGSFNGITTTFTTSVPPGTSQYYVTAGTASQLIISLGGVIQEPDVDYTVSTNSITFTTAPAAGLSFFGVLCGDALNTGVPSDGSVTTSKLGSNLTVDLASGSASTPSLTFDANTGIYSPGEDQVAVSTGGTARLYIDSSGRVGLGTSSPGKNLDIEASDPRLRLSSNASNNATIELLSNAKTSFIYSQNSGNLNIQGNSSLIFLSNGGTEAARIDTSGRLLVGTSSSVESNAKIQVQNGHVHLYENNNAAGAGYELQWSTNGGATGRLTAAIRGVQQTTGTSGGYLTFSTTADGASSPTERMRITSSGAILVNSTSVLSGAPFINVAFSPSTNSAFCSNDTAGGSGSQHFRFFSNGAQVGYISTTTTSTGYATSSDYRLKENVVPLTGAAARIKQLKPSQFNFIVDPGKTVDGFIAHEAQAVVPECVTGEKDAVDDEGNPVYQGIDQSKLVPLLTAALQEALAEIESLKARVAALEPAAPQKQADPGSK